jgi:hypothetical protein
MFHLVVSPTKCGYHIYSIALKPNKTRTREEAISLSTAHEVHVPLDCFSSLWAIPRNAFIHFTACITRQLGIQLFPCPWQSSRKQNLTDK